MPQEMIVTCPSCLMKNRLLKRSTQGAYRCGHCQRQLSNPFVSLINEPHRKQTEHGSRPAPEPEDSDCSSSSSPQSGRESTRTRLNIETILKLNTFILIAFAGLGLLGIIRDHSIKSQPSPSSTVISPSPTASLTPSWMPSLTPSPSSKCSQRATDEHGSPFPTQSGYLKDEHGSPFPTQSGYLKGYPPLAMGGYSSVTVDNSGNDSDIFVKLFSLDLKPPKAISVLFICAHDTFTVKDIKPGRYDVRYRDLTSGDLSRTPPFDLEEVPTASGFKISQITLKLYKVLDGNMETQSISKDEFEEKD
jgi:hypothetical protein